MDEKTLTEEYENTMNKAHYLNSIIGCLYAVDFNEVIPDDFKCALFYVNEEFQKIEDRQQKLYKPITELYHNQEKENEENGKN